MINRSSFEKSRGATEHDLLAGIEFRGVHFLYVVPLKEFIGIYIVFCLLFSSFFKHAFGCSFFYLFYFFNFLFPISLYFPKQFTVRGSQCFKEWSPWCWMVWSGSRPDCLPLPFVCLPVLFICLPGWVIVVGFPAGLSPTSFHLSPTSFHLSPTSLQLSPSSFICLSGWVLVVGFPAGLSPTSFHLSPTSFHLFPTSFHCLPGWVLVVGFPAGLSPTSFHLSPTSFHLSPRLGACGRVPGWLVSHFLSFVSQARCFWSGSRPACLPLPFICLPLLFRLGASGLVPGWLVSHFFSFVSHFFSHFLAFVSHFFPKQFTVRGSQFFLKMCPPFVSLLVSAHFHWPCSISIHLSPRSVTAGVRPFPLTMQHFFSFVSQVRPFPLAMQHFYSFVSQACHCWCPPFSAGHVAFL